MLKRLLLNLTASTLSILLIAASMSVLLAQNNTLSVSGAVTHFQSGSSLPGTCIVADEFFQTSATAGINKYLCTATNTWTQVNSFISAGTGATTRTSIAKMADIISVKDFGAKGDGVTYDDTAVANTIAYAFTLNGAQVYFPAGDYRLANCINLTNHVTGGLVVRGAGRGDNSTTNWSTTITSENATCAFDTTSSQHVTIQDMTIWLTSSVLPGPIGILAARTATNIDAQFQTYRNLGIYANDVLFTNSITPPTCRNATCSSVNHGSIGIYNFGSEINTIDGLYIVTDQPLAIVANNIYSVTSPYQTIYAGGITSMSVVQVTGGTTLTAFGGPAIRIDGGVDLHFGPSLYLTSYQTFNTTWRYAIDITDDATGVYIQSNVEQFLQLIQYYGIQRQLYVDVHWNMNGTTNSNIVAYGGSTECTELVRPRINVEGRGGGSPRYLLDTAGGTNVCGVIGGEISMNSGAGINNPFGVFTAFVSSEDANPIINTGSQPFSGYIVNGGNGSTSAQGASWSITDAGAGKFASVATSAPSANSGNTFFQNADFQDSSSTAFQNITGLTWVMPASMATNMPYSCYLSYNQTIAASAVSFGIKASVAPTNIYSNGKMQTNTTAYTDGNLPTLTTTTATAVVTATPSAITTIWNAELHGFIENPSQAASTINVVVKQATAADLVVVKRGSFCTVQ